MLTLYTYWRSSASYRVRIALALKGLAYRSVTRSLLAGEQGEPDYLALNPQGYLPALVLESGEALTQSVAIIEYLDELQPEPALLPHDAVDRARARAFAAAIACDIHPIQNLSVLKYIRAEHGQDDAGVKAWCRSWIMRGFDALETTASQCDGAFLFGAQPGLAECCLIPQISNARRFGVDMAAYPSLAEIDARCRVLASFAVAAPERQPDAPAG